MLDNEELPSDKIGIFAFGNAAGLESAGRNLYTATEASGQAVLIESPKVNQRELEGSNVDLAEEMTQLIRAQRAYQIASKVIATADGMEALANDLRDEYRNRGDWMLDIRGCERCNTIYKYGNNKICNKCIGEIDEIMRRVREYLEENKNADVSTLSKELDVSEKDIFYLLREERLSLVGEGKGLTCKRCGKGIESGSYCDVCIKQMKSEFQAAASEFKESKLKTDDSPNLGGRASGMGRGKMYTAFLRKKEK